MATEHTGNISSTYDPLSLEERIYESWMKKGYFHAEVEPEKVPFSIVIPPPNVTGVLHLGHAMDETMQDILIRWSRMKSMNTLWIPGTDHAGIATQARVEGALAQEGISRHDLGRERFLERVWDWKEKYGGTIISQLKRLGASCDWDRLRFTMDEGCSEAVKEVFIRLYNEGLIYQGSYIVNWCPRCHTAISDIEVEHEDREGNLWYIKYPYADGSGYITVATTRPETMLGDTAVAVNPSDGRYSDKNGKSLILPLIGREIPIIVDEFVDPAFGTGAVKVTPAHDPNDYAMGQRHSLATIIVIGHDGRMTSDAGKFTGLDRYEARKAVIKELEEQGLLLKVEAHSHAVGQCSRCDTIIEPLVSKQWFVKMKPLAEPALQAVRDGRIQFVPERFTKIYTNWLEDIKDWCISRQLWWGHRIPVYYCQDCNETIAAKEKPSKCGKCGSENLIQDPDVLDTWFSSGLWPFSTMGWPKDTGELKHFYPTSVLVTGRDIIFFWVARMIFMSMHFMDEVPFKKVLIHGLVLDGEGKKMSKSKGNTIDPMNIMSKYGADSLRFTIITGTAPGTDVRFQQERLEGSRNFANKIWNASRFTLMNLTDFAPSAHSLDDLCRLDLTIADRWIISRYNSLIEEVDRQLGRYDLGEAAKAIYEFIWDEFCDWYIEIVKPRLYGKETDASKGVAQNVLWFVLKHTLELLHPFMPFLTEEIWQHLPHEGESIMVAQWPKTSGKADDSSSVEKMLEAMDIIRNIRNQRAEVGVPPSKRIKAIFRASESKSAELGQIAGMISHLAGLDELTSILSDAETPDKSISLVASGYEIFLPLAGLVDADKEIARLNKEIESVDAEISFISAKLANNGFVSKAPAAVVEKEKAKLAAAEEKKALLTGRIEELR